MTKAAKSNDALIVQLRQANRNLVIAMIGAQDLQAKAGAAIHRQQEFLAMLAFFAASARRGAGG